MQSTADAYMVTATAAHAGISDTTQQCHPSVICCSTCPETGMHFIGQHAHRCTYALARQIAKRMHTHAQICILQARLSIFAHSKGLAHMCTHAFTHALTTFAPEHAHKSMQQRHVRARSRTRTHTLICRNQQPGNQQPKSTLLPRAGAARTPEPPRCHHRQQQCHRCRTCPPSASGQASQAPGSAVPPHP